MSGVALAVGVGAAATLYAGSEAAGATKSAASDAENAQMAALAQQKALAAPYTAQGQTGIQTYNALTTGTPGQIAGTLASTPGYNATYGQGVEAAERAAAASGLNLSGNQITGVEQFGAQLGDQTYQQAINNALGQEQIGQAAAAGTAANIGTAATNVGNIAIGQGNTQAGIVSNEVAGITRAGQTGASQYLTYNALNNLNNPAGGGTPSSGFYSYGGAGAGASTAPTGTYYSPDLNAGP